jgi:hypothetical protein
VSEHPPSQSKREHSDTHKHYESKAHIHYTLFEIRVLQGFFTNKPYPIGFFTQSKTPKGFSKNPSRYVYMHALLDEPPGLADFGRPAWGLI